MRQSHILKVHCEVKCILWCYSDFKWFEMFSLALLWSRTMGLLSASDAGVSLHKSSKISSTDFPSAKDYIKRLLITTLLFYKTKTKCNVQLCTRHSPNPNSFHCIGSGTQTLSNWRVQWAMLDNGALHFCAWDIFGRAHITYMHPKNGVGLIFN